jgi:hypothetical protein
VDDHNAQTAGSADACQVTARDLQIVIAVRIDGDEISGTAAGPDGERRPFLGWLGLIGALDALLEAPPPPARRA